MNFIFKKYLIILLLNTFLLSFTFAANNEAIQKVLSKYESLQSSKPLNEDNAKELISIYKAILNSDPSLTSLINQLREKLEKNKSESALLSNEKIIKTIETSILYYLTTKLKETEFLSDDELVEKFDLLRKGHPLKKKEKIEKVDQTLPQASITQNIESAPTKAKINIEETLNKIADAITEHQNEFISILTEINNYQGSLYEIEQSIKTLRGVKEHEENYLRNIEGVQNVAVYGARNIPLYTLIMHALIPSLIAQKVWFRTPELSRDVYVKLFNKLKELLPEIDFSSLHLLTENSDTQYDLFRKKYVMGLNKQGTNFLRTPSEAVIFVGSTETGDKILEEIYNKYEQNKDKLAPFKQIFLRFGSGLNPVFVTEYAANNLEAAVNGVIKSIKINNTQDCIAPKFYAINEKLLTPFTTKLLKALKDLRFGNNSEESADYSPLNYAYNLDELIQFKEKFKEFLVTKEAIIDPVSKRVDPHVFKFPFSYFKKVPLNDFYAPFILLFSYGPEKLKEIVSDSRVRDRAMYASIYGNSANTEMFKIRKQLEDTYHSTQLNNDIYKEESGNFPFGGYGGSASTVTLIQNPKGSEMERYSFNRPLLFSKETKNFFGEANKVQDQNLSEMSNKAFLEDFIKLSQSIDSVEKGDIIKKSKWNTIKRLNLTRRKHGISYLKELAKSGGIYSVVVCSRYKIKKEEIEYLFGTKVLCLEDKLPLNSSKFKNALILHYSAIKEEVDAFNKFQGQTLSHNPHLGYGYLTPLMMDRINEYRVVTAISPGVMPKAEVFNDFKDELPSPFHEDLREILNEINNILKGKRTNQELLAEEKSFKIIKEKLANNLNLLFNHVQSRHRMGTFVKNYGESTTGDLGIQITTFHYNPENMVNQFIESLSNFKMTGDFSSAEVQSKFLSSLPYETGTKFLSKLITSPDDLLFQERVKLDKTDLGFIKEIRVDFIDGEPVNARPRYSHEYMREEEEEAMKFLKDFFQKAPEEFQYLSGGADIAKTEEGKWIIIELNTGVNSGSTLPSVFPIERNEFISKLQDHPTPLILDLQKIFHASLEDQRKFLKSIELTQEDEIWHKYKKRDISLAEYAKWLRNRYLDEFRSNSTKENGEKCLKTLRALFKGVGSKYNKDLNLYLKGAENYISTKLLQKSK